jgi:hypothetical protein
MPKAAATEWAIGVRLANGSIRYFCQPTGRQGQEQWSPRENQSERYSSEGEARAQIRSFETSAAAVEYVVVPLSKSHG